mgnify:CR=1 FL=1
MAEKAKTCQWLCDVLQFQIVKKLLASRLLNVRILTVVGWYLILESLLHKQESYLGL